MQKDSFRMMYKMHIFKAASCLTLMMSAMTANGSETYRLRQSPLGNIGGEVASKVDQPGFFGTAVITYARIDKVADDDGNDIGLPSGIVPLPTGLPTRGAIPDGTYALTVPAGTIDFHQTQTQLNLQGGYMSRSTYGDGRIAFSINLPLIRQERTFNVTQPSGTVTPAAAVAALPPALRAAIFAAGTAANTQLQSSVAAVAAKQNADVSGMGDTELTIAWLRHIDRLKIVGGVSVFVPTGAYDKTRGPNPGFGNFYTVRPSLALRYSLDPATVTSDWNSGVTVATRMSYGFNTTNKDTNYKSGDFIYTEMAVLKVTGDWAFGANMLRIQQVSKDTGSGVPTSDMRYRNSGISPFMSYKIKGQEAGFNLQYSRNFGSRNALVSHGLQLRFIKAW